MCGPHGGNAVLLEAFRPKPCVACDGMAQFPSMKAKRLLRVLMSKRTLAPGEVRRVLVHHVGLAEDEALRLL